MKSILVSALLLAASPAAAQHLAILGPHFPAAPPDGAAAAAIIARAKSALRRPPGAIPRLHTEGTLPGHGIRDISLKAKQDQPIVLDLALAWRLTGDRRYLVQAGAYLDAWVRIYRMSFNPIDETGFDALLLATDLAEDDLPAESRARLERFWREMARGYLDAIDAGPRNAITNWQSHRVKLATMAAYQVGDAGLIARARAAFRAQVAANIRVDGSVHDFEERDALHYVTYDLDPLLMAALAARLHGDDWYAWQSPGGASLARAVAWLAPYARGEKAHVEFAHSKIAFDRERAAAGQAEYAPHRWDPAGAVDTYALAALFDPAYRGLATDLAGRRRRPPPGWVALLALEDR